MNLSGKRAIVTGATKGIGKAIAQHLVNEDCRVVLCARTEEDLQAVTSELGSRATGFCCDVTREDSVRQLIEFSAQHLGGLDILINNAGLGIFKSVEALSPEEWRRTISTNLDSLFYTCHFAAPLLKESGSGFVINIGSLAGKNAFPTGAAYNASKFGLIGFSEAFMQEVRQDGIRVAYVMPGSVDTWFGGSPPTGEGSWKLSPEDVAEVVIETLERHPRNLTSRIEMRPSKPPNK